MLTTREKDVLVSLTSLLKIRFLAAFALLPTQSIDRSLFLGFLIIFWLIDLTV